MAATLSAEPINDNTPKAPQLAIGKPSDSIPPHYVLEDGHENVNHYPVFSQDGTYLASIAPRRNESKIFLWNVKTRKLLNSWKCPAMVSRIAFWKDRLLAGDVDGDIHAYSFEGSKKPVLLQFRDNLNDYGFQSMDISQDGSTLAVARRHIYVQKNLTNERTTLSFPIQVQSLGWPKSVAVTADGSKLLAVSASAQLGLWDLKTEKLIWSFHKTGHKFECMAYTPKSNRFATSGYSPDEGSGWIRFWDANTGKELGGTKVMSGRIFQIHFSADGTLIFCSGADRAMSPSMILGWNMTTGKQLVSFVADQRDAAFFAISPDGKWMAQSGITGPIRLFAMESLLTKDDR